jgi:hypothetical protein
MTSARESSRTSRALRLGRRGEPMLTVRQPWASAIFEAGKNVENRTWATEYRGRIWIHAGVAKTRAEPDAWAQAHCLWLPEEPLSRGMIVGSVELTDIVRDVDSPWALPDHYHWILLRPMVLIRPVKWKGRLGLTFFRPPQGEVRPARRARKAAR